MTTSASTSQHALCPAVAVDFRGVAIALAPRPLANSRLVVHGTFQIPWQDAEAIEPPLHRALALVVQLDDGYAVATPFREHVLFDDDEVQGRETMRGYFTMDVFALLQSESGGDYHILVSLGTHVSNVERLLVK